MKARPIDTTLAPSKLVSHNDSHAISKQKPKIRIIHIVAPKVIKTDVQNFRELVQRLTGKQGSVKKGKLRGSPLVAQAKAHGSSSRKNVESTANIQRMKKEIEEIHGGGIPNPFYSFLGEVDGFMQDMNEFPLLQFRSSQINTLGERPLW